MPVLHTKEELIAALENSIFSPDPIADLARKGYTLSPALNSEWEAARAGKTLPRVPPGVGPANFKGTLALKAAPPPALPIADVPPGSYDLVAGITLDAANEALAAEFQSGTIPHEIALDQNPSEMLVVTSFFVAVPGGQISRLHITSAPVLTSTTDGSPVVAVQMPIQIDWVHVTTLALGRTVSHLVTKAIGTLQLTMRLVGVGLSGDPKPPFMTIAVVPESPSSGADSPRLTLDPNSPVQLAKTYPPDQIDYTALGIQEYLNSLFQNKLSWPLSPIFTLPIGTLEVNQLDVVANGGVLLAGVNVHISAGDPSTLTSLLPDSASNIFLEVRDLVPNLLLQQALASGKLTAIAVQHGHSNAVVDSASASFQNNAIVVATHGRLLNECGTLDLGFWANLTITLEFQGSSIKIDQKTDTGVDTSNHVWCLLMVLGLAALLALAAGIFGGIGGAVGVLAILLLSVGVYNLAGLLNGSDSNLSPINLTQPIPGSDMLPTLSGGNIQVGSGTLLITATAGTKLDDINLEIYVRFFAPRTGAVAIGDVEPLVGVKVVMMDQDVPLPPDEEVPELPADTTQTISDPYSEVPGQVTTTTYSLELPTSDQKLGEGTTDLNGTVRFQLLRDQFPTAGTIVATITTGVDDNSIPPTTSTNEESVTDNTPDLYFLVTMPDGSVVDSRTFVGLLRASSGQFGSFSNPLTITLGTSVGGVHWATGA